MAAPVDASAPQPVNPVRVVIMGAAGRDFHNFNVVYRGDPRYEVLAFTAAQIPNISGRRYPPELAGPHYPAGIPIVPEAELDRFLRDHAIDRVDFAYSDIAHVEVMHRASRALAAGADFCLLGPRSTQLRSTRPVVAVCAVRTGSGKSPATRFIARVLMKLGRKVVVVRHPMPYGDLTRQAVQRFAVPADLDRHECTFEEREEYEPLIAAGVTVFAGVDYQRILRQAESEADVILWDGGNNDLPFFVPALHIVLVDALRPGQERAYHPGEANVRAADVLVISKVDSARAGEVEAIRESFFELNPRAAVVEAALPISLDDPEALRGKKVIVVEDGPTLTHGGMPHGAGWLAAVRAGAEIVDPRPWAVGSIHEVYRNFPHIGPVLPAMGYGRTMTAELEQTIAAVPAAAVVAGTPVDLGRVIRTDKPVIRVRYEYQDASSPGLVAILRDRFGSGPA